MVPTVMHYCLPVGHSSKTKPCHFSLVTSLCTRLNAAALVQQAEAGERWRVSCERRFAGAIRVSRRLCCPHWLRQRQTAQRVCIAQCQLCFIYLVLVFKTKDTSPGLSAAVDGKIF